jgi:hypothetical protein
MPDGMRGWPWRNTRRCYRPVKAGHDDEWDRI